MSTCLVSYAGDVYRLRAGDYRIVYSFGDGWVSLLGVDDRKDVYRGEHLVEEAPSFDIAKVPEVEDILRPVEQPDYAARKRNRAAGDELPVRLDDDLLARLHVPAQHYAALKACKTLDELTVADVPDMVRERIFDCIMSSDFDRILQQADFVTGDVSDLLKFVEGELVAFLLKLNPEQEKFVGWSVSGSGPVLLKGGPGTGKSTVALFRARAMVEALRKAGNPDPRLLFTTYTNALVSFSEQLLERLMGADRECVQVRTADSLIMEIVKSVDRGQEMADSAALRSLLTEAVSKAQFDGNGLQRRAQAQTIERLTADYLLEEFGSVIEAREIENLEGYLSAPRAGRRVRLNNTQRTAVWRVYESFCRLLKRRKERTWSQLRRRAAQIARGEGWTQRYDGVLIDESQDLEPTVLRTLVALCRTPDRLFVTADANQSIYGSSFKWADVHADLRFKGRTGYLKANHRSTREVGEAAHSYLQAGALEAYEEERVYMQTGALPAVRAVKNSYGETQLLARFLPGAARTFRLGIGACAVLVPSENAGRDVANFLKDAGVEAVFMSGRDLDLGRPAVKVVTLKSAKGLEFPIVAVAGFIEGGTPGVPKRADQEELEESLLRERRTMFVAMTRAMRALLVVIPSDHSSPLFEGFDERFWNTRSGVTA